MNEDSLQLVCQLCEYLPLGFPKFLKSFLESARIPGSDPMELYRLGKLVLESIEFRRSLLERRRGPKWSEENELRRIERQVWKIMSKLDKDYRKRRPELARFFKDLKQIMSDYENTKAKPPVPDVSKS